MARISAILLGAGESKRMGANKLLLPWGKKTVLTHCVDTLIRSRVREVIVVLGGLTRPMEGQLKGPKVRVVYNAHYRGGMSTSIRKGVGGIDPRSRGILIALGDMPFLSAKTVNALVRAFGQGKGEIVAPRLRRRTGHPVIFDRRYKKELLELYGDVGGRTIMERHSDRVRWVRTRSEGVVKDVDTWRDYGKRINPFDSPV